MLESRSGYYYECPIPKEHVEEVRTRLQNWHPQAVRVKVEIYFNEGSALLRVTCEGYPVPPFWTNIEEQVEARISEIIGKGRR